MEVWLELLVAMAIMGPVARRQLGKVQGCPGQRRDWERGGEYGKAWDFWVPEGYSTCNFFTGGVTHYHWS